MLFQQKFSKGFRAPCSKRNKKGEKETLTNLHWKSCHAHMNGGGGVIVLPPLNRSEQLLAKVPLCPASKENDAMYVSIC